VRAQQNFDPVINIQTVDTPVESVFMPRSLIFLLALGILAGCRGQTFIELQPNLIIPNPPPSASLADWTASNGRTPITNERDDATLRGFRYTGANPQGRAILFFNGNGMVVAASDALYRRLAALGPDVYVFDYRGYGFSTGAPDVATYRADGLHLYDALAAATPNHRVIVYGFSMGTAMASYVASVREVRGLILAAPIASAQEEFPIFEARMGYPASSIADSHPSPEAKDIFDETGLVEKSHAPLLILHGTADSLVPIRQGREIFGSSNSVQKQMVELKDAEHNQAASQPESFAAVQKFLVDLEKPAPQDKQFRQ
jgi:pimeloyl-ACP methyl ester carboxylesterase